MSDIEIKDELVNIIKTKALMMETRNQRLPQAQRASDMDMVREHIKKLKQELEGEKRNLK